MREGGEGEEFGDFGVFRQTYTGGNFVAQKASPAVTHTLLIVCLKTQRMLPVQGAEGT